MMRVRTCTMRCRCHNSCRRSRFSQLGTQIRGKSSFSTLAKQLGYFDGVNPVQGTSVNPHASDAQETHAYSLEEINSLISIFPEPASTAFSIAALAGLRRGEIEGLDWSDFHNGALWVSR